MQRHRGAGLPLGAGERREHERVTRTARHDPVDARFSREPAHRQRQGGGVGFARGGHAVGHNDDTVSFMVSGALGYPAERGADIGVGPAFHVVEPEHASHPGRERVHRASEVDPELEDFSYAPESYDAAILIALAAIQAQSVESRAIADNLVAVSKDGTECTTFAECVDLLGQGEDIDYNGASGPITFSDAGDVTEATIGIYEYGADNTYTNVDFQFGSLEE